MVLIAITYVLFRTIGKILGSYVGGTFAKSPKNVSKYLGFCLLPQAQAAIGLALYAYNKIIFSQYAILLLVVIMISSLFNEIFGPLGVRYSLIKCNEVDLSDETTEIVHH